VVAELKTSSGPSSSLPARIPARPRFSIVTPSFNHGRLIRRAIDSVLGQQGDFDLEYFVVDGGSTDGTLAILREYEGRLEWSSEADRGQADAINKGLRRSTGDIVGWLNSDDVLLPGALGRIACAFREKPVLEWVHGRCRIIDENDRRIRRPIEVYKHLRSQRFSFGSLLAENFISQMTVFWRRKALEEVGYLDASLRFAFDYDMWLRLAQRGRPVYISTPQACFRWYESSKSGAGFQQQFAEDTQVAQRYARGEWWPMARKRAVNSAIVGAYSAMAAVRRLRRALLATP
jgi:glycosyltransferase involved in cell wall biosynthesis